MKKILTSVLTLALVLCCFTFVGCDLFKDKDEPKPATIEQTLAICDQFIEDLKAIETKISAQDYEYPAADAQASASQVSNIAKSSIGIRYSNYMDFDVEEVFNEDLGRPITVLGEYSEAVTYYENIETFINVYKSNNLSLNTIYTFDFNDTNVYIKLTNNKSQICLSSKSVDKSNDDNMYCFDYIINLNSNNAWKSFECKANNNGDEFDYMYIEKSTNENRIFDQYIDGEIDGFKNEDDYGDVILSNFDESCQKMLFVHFHTQPTTTVQELVVDYIANLNIVDNIDTANAVEIEVSLGE